MGHEYVVEMRNISKRFGGIQALQDVSLKVKKGEIHALIGENGAGKSTLMKILAGAYQNDKGNILIDGKDVKLTSPKIAMDLGVSVIYQELMLAPDLSVAENIFIDNLVSKGMILNWKNLRKRAKEQLSKLGFDDIDPDAKVETLTVARQQIVEICKCLARNSKVIVFDEPTAVLTFSEIEKLFGIIKQLKSEGVSVIYISHRLEELFELSDNITVLKDGKYVDTVPTASTNKVELVSKMVGRQLTQLFPKRNAKIGDEILKVENLYVGTTVNNVSFTVRSGEVVGFSGLVGAGRTEAMRAIFGADKKDSGKIIYLGKETNFKSPKEAIENGFGLLPEDRKGQGLLVEQSIRVNTTLASMRKIKKLDIINHRKERGYVEKLLSSISTKYGSMEDKTNSLSGGNQQKISLAKWLSADCKCIVFDEPTRGVDVGAKTEIYKVINKLAEEGVGIIMISSEMTEIIGMCDRAVVMRQGSIAGEVKKSELSENNLIKLAMGV
ncbi:sugar ABC transporter ATP-binding protein [Pullulanibacillus sp. KACC 23026]|uniref:sugar ABC transporter ATP-binding protein n=1 Tax=Pullulanibacillus sp. KACC 23026 TaxID=3028315 RepID=UPI0023AEBF26|nr:sugar ABC transporter ATP-binding protein [Pullulanibacillus sp. KACC 23026]WEG13358.1 sugar ABC transporter ATP-binding protein [Pullulanibacillus sp. KACC 23026]